MSLQTSLVGSVPVCNDNNKMGCGATFVKYVLFFFNLFFALAGLALLGLGVAVRLRIKDLAQGLYDIAPVLVIGSIIFIIAFFGCCGAIRESNCMLVLYSVFLIILIIIQVVLASLIFMTVGKVNAAVTQSMNENFSNMTADRMTTEEFNKMQTYLKCCGTTGPLSYPQAQQVSLPQSCCATELAGTCTTLNAYQTGCTTVISGLGGALAGVTIAVAVVEVIGVIFSLYLANHARNKYSRLM